MALVARSICLSNNESIGNTCMRSRLAIFDERFYRRRAIRFRVILKFRSTSRRSRYFQLISSDRNFNGLGSKCWTLPFNKTEEISSSFGTGTSKSEVAPETYDLLMQA